MLFRSSQITDEGLATLGNLKNLNALDISNTAITDQGLAALGGLSSLNSVSLTGTQVSQAGVDKLQQLLPDTFIDFQNQEFDLNQGDPGGGFGGQPRRNPNRQASAGDTSTTPSSGKSPLDAITSFFSGGNDEETTIEQETPEEPVEEEEKAGGTLGAIFRSLNPVD